MPASSLSNLVSCWKQDSGSTYATWFLWEDRLKNFRSIRRGIGQVAREIAEGRFGNAYRGSSLETVVGSIAEQRQVFKGADHAFLWKPKLRIPDIYENADNQRAFGRLLHECNCCDNEEAIIEAIHRIDSLAIKGLGPAVANILYFIHPTLVPPFNTAIMRGYNSISGAGIKLGRWDHYLAMRKGILEMNTTHRHALSNDLGAIGGLLFDVGHGRYPMPPREGDEGARRTWLADLEKVRAEAEAHRSSVVRDEQSERSHTEIQGWLRDLGLALGYGVWIAANDRNRRWADGRLAEGCLEDLPAAIAAQPGSDAVRLIDVLWIDAGDSQVAAAFEVEHTTSIYSGIVRLLDLALGSEDACRHLFLVAPDAREGDVRLQLARPAFSRVRELGIRYVPYGELAEHRESIARFGSGLKPLEAIARAL